MLTTAFIHLVFLLTFDEHLLDAVAGSQLVFFSTRHGFGNTSSNRGSFLCAWLQLRPGFSALQYEALLAQPHLLLLLEAHQGVDKSSWSVQCMPRGSMRSGPRCSSEHGTCVRRESSFSHNDFHFPSTACILSLRKVDGTARLN